jgi:hypothetical protein
MSASLQNIRCRQSSEATAPDWPAVAAGAWEGPSWKATARECHEARQRGGGKPQPPDPQLLALLDPGISLEQAQRRLLERHRSGAAASTVEALAYSLRRRIHALTAPATLERLSKLNERQLSEVVQGVQNFKQKIAPAWTPDEAEALIEIWGESHA